MAGALSSLSPADAELVARTRAGDRNAYGMIVQRHQSPLYRHARGMGLGHDTSLDLVQDTFIKGYARLKECRDPAHIRAWLFRILRNLCLDHFKDVRRSTVSFSDMPIESHVRTTAANADLVVTLNDALERLPVPLREAFLLKHDAGYSYDDIAEMTGASTSAVKMRVHRAREALREMFIDEESVPHVTIA